MPMPVEASDVAVGDWSPNYGTVTEIKENKNTGGDILSYNFKFFNGYELSNVDPEFVFIIEQGGAEIVHNGMPDPSQIRPGLAADHGKD